MSTVVPKWSISGNSEPISLLFLPLVPGWWSHVGAAWANVPSLPPPSNVEPFGPYVHLGKLDHVRFEANNVQNKFMQNTPFPFGEFRWSGHQVIRCDDVSKNPLKLPEILQGSEKKKIILD